MGPAQRGLDFQPLPAFRSKNWEARWQRIRRATQEMRSLPPIDVLRTHDGYWVTDGHNRVAAAKVVGQVEVDADVKGVVLPGQPIMRPSGSLAPVLAESSHIEAARPRPAVARHDAGSDGAGARPRGRRPGDPDDTRHRRAADDDGRPGGGSMTRRLSIDWPDARPFAGREGRPIRILAASDEPDRALEGSINRDALGPIDLVVGCGDLSPDWLCFLGDAFRAPLVYVRGNHDRQGPWPTPRRPAAARRRRPTTACSRASRWSALPWPSFRKDAAPRDEKDAWLQVTRLAPGLALHRRPPVLVVSHAPPRDAGDTPTDAYHVGFAGYRVIADRLRPPLWLHGHTNPAAQADWRTTLGPTTVCQRDRLSPGGTAASRRRIGVGAGIAAGDRPGRP